MRRIVPEIKAISSTDWNAADGNKNPGYSIPFHIEIGDIAHDGADLFQLEILGIDVSEDNVNKMKHRDSDGWCNSRAKLRLSEISVDNIFQYIKEKIDELGPYQSWPSFAEKMAPYLIWEFEGMPYPPNY